MPPPEQELEKSAKQSNQNAKTFESMSKTLKKNVPNKIN